MKIIMGALWFFPAWLLAAAEIFVNPFEGKDANPGTNREPLRSFAAAIAKAEPGDIIRMMPVDKPVHANFRVRNKRGTPEHPIIIDGGFNVYTGSAPVQEEKWGAVEPGLYKTTRSLPGGMALRYFMCFNGKMNRMDRPVKWRQAALKKPDELNDYEWTMANDDFYFRIPAGKTPVECGVEEPNPALDSGVALSGESEHLVFRNMIVKNFWNDGYNIHQNCRNILFENIAALYNGDDGISAHGACRVTFRNLVSIGNSTGICHIDASEGVHENVYIARSAGRDLYMLNRGNTFRNVAIEGTSPGGIEFTNDNRQPEARSDNRLAYCFFHAPAPGGRLLFLPGSDVTAQNCASHGYPPGKRHPDNWVFAKDSGAVEEQIGQIRDRLFAAFGKNLAAELPPAAPAPARQNTLLDENTPYDKLSGEVVTPHIKWAEPRRGGKIKALVIAPTSQRETVELAQRLSLDYTPLMTHSFDATYFVRDLHKKENAAIDPLFKERLKREYDVVIIGKMSWQGLPGYARSRIIDMVRNGTGLVYVCPRDASELDAVAERRKEGEDAFCLSGIPLGALPVLKDMLPEKLLNSGKIGKGRFVEIDYGQGKPRRSWHCFTPERVYEDGTLHYEYYHSFLAKVIIWAANKTPEARIEKVNAAGSLLNLAVKGKPLGRIDLETAIRDGNNVVIDRQSMAVDLEQGEKEISLKLPFLKTGRHFLDVWIKKDGQVIDWSSTVKAVDAGNRMEKLSLNKTSYKPGETAEGKVVLRRAPPENMKLKIRLKDNFGRIVAEQELPAKGREYGFAVPVEQALSILMKVEARLLDGENRVVCDAETGFTAPSKKHDDFSFRMWAWNITDANSYIVNILLKQFYEYGVDTLYDSPTAFSHGAAAKNRIMTRAAAAAGANLNIVPYMFGHTSTPELNDKTANLVRNPCFTDPQYLEQLANTIRDVVPVIMDHGASIYSLNINGEIARRKDYCLSPTCQASFRARLKKIYKTPGELNREWDSSYKSWDEVIPMTFEQAKAHGNFAPWADHRMHMEEVYAGLLDFCRSRIREIDPDALVGIDEAKDTTSFAGFNWRRILGVLDYCGAYTHNPTRRDQRDFTRSFLEKKPNVSGLWMGSYNRSEEYNRCVPWQTLFNGMSCVWWWMGYNNDGTFTWSALDPGFKPMPFFAQAVEEIREIKRGIGKLLLDSVREHDRIAIHYSPASIHAATIVNSPDAPPNPLYNSFIFILEDLGLQYDFVANEQIEAGALGKGGYKVLILPGARALSAIEADRIQEFARDGGMLIADAVPAVMDGHCKALPANPLADVFGGYKTGLALNGCGKGKAVWLGDFLEGYARSRSGEPSRKRRDKIREILKAGGVEPRLKATGADGKALDGAETVFFRNGKAEYVCLLKDFENADSPSDQKATVKFPSQSHVYDVRSGKYLGKTDEIQTDFPPARAKVFALMPYRVEALEIQLDRQEYGQGDAISYALKIKASADRLSTHVFRLELAGPDGKTVDWYSENILAQNGTCTGQKLLALNEHKGSWIIRAKDVVSGKTSEKQFTVRFR